jgi:hypothetical protein
MGTFKDLAGDVIGAVNTLVALFAVFLWLALIWIAFWFFIIKGSDENARAEGRNALLFGFLTALIFTGVWGIIFLLQRVFNFAGIPEFTVF